MPLPATPIKKKIAIPGAELEDNVQASAMGALAKGLEGPSTGLNAAIGQGRSAVAQFAKDTQRQAAGMAAKTGALGQGTESGLIQNTRQSVMQNLAKNEANNAQLISDEQKGYMDKALAIGQENKQLKQNQGQFDVTSGQEQQKIQNQAGQFNTTAGLEQQRIQNQASQFQTTAGQSQQQIDAQKSQFTETLNLQKDELAQKFGDQNMRLLADLGAGIPVVASKLIDSMMGKSGQAMTPADKADLSKWYEDQKAKGEKIDSQMQTLIDKMVTDTVNPQKTPSETAGEARDTAMNAILKGDKPMTTMTPADWTQVANDPGMMQALAQSNPSFKPSAVVPKVKSAAEFEKSGLKPGDVVMQDGKPMKIVEFKTEKYSNWTGNTRKRNYTVATDLATNKQIRIGDTGEYDPD